MADSGDFRFPYRFEKLYFNELVFSYRFEKLYSAETRWPYRFENHTKIENRKTNSGTDRLGHNRSFARLRHCNWLINPKGSLPLQYKRCLQIRVFTNKG